MILTVTLNMALDVTYRVRGVALDRANRVDEVAQRAGGKGVNVARVLAALGRPSIVCGLAGGPTGEAVRADLERSGLTSALTPIAGESRRTLTVVDSQRGDATGYWEAGPLVSAGEWQDFVAGFDELLHGAGAVALSGSLPPGVPPGAYADLGARAGRAGVPVVLDADGEVLRSGLDGHPAIVKPNLEELERVTGVPDPVAGAEQLLDAGAQAVVVSRGPDGLLAVTREGRWRAVPARRVAGNPTGAGDAVVAALVAGMVDGKAWPDCLREAVALSSAAVSAPLAGDFDASAYEAGRDAIRVEELDGEVNLA